MEDETASPNCLPILKRFVQGGWGDVHLWEMLANGHLIPTLVSLVAAAGAVNKRDPVPMLHELWELLSDSRAVDQIRLHYIADDSVDTERICRNARALVALAQAAVAAQTEMDASAAVLTWWQRAGELLVDRRLAAASHLEHGRLDLSASGGVRDAFELAAKFGWPAVSLRFWTERLLGIHVETHNPGVKIPIMGVTSANEGFLGDLHLVMTEPGHAELFEHPEMALRPLRTDLVATIAEQYGRHAPAASVSWSLTIRHMASKPWKQSPWIALDGKTVGAAAAVGFHLLVNGGVYDGGCTLIAAIGTAADQPLKDELFWLEGLEPKLRAVVAWNDENPARTPIGRIGLAASSGKSQQTQASHDPEVELLQTVGEAVEFCRPRAAESIPETTKPPRVPNWLQYARLSAFTTYVGALLWLLIGCIRLAIAPVRTPGVLEISWLSCTLISALLYLSFPSLRSRLAAVTRILFYVPIFLGVMMFAVVGVLSPYSPRGSWSLYSLWLNALLLLVSLCPGIVAHFRVHQATEWAFRRWRTTLSGVRSNLSAVLWVFIAAVALWAPLMAIGSAFYLIRTPHQSWRFLPLESAWLIVNIDALRRSHRRYASARIGIVAMLLLAFYALALTWGFELLRGLDPVHVWLGIVILRAIVPIRFSRKPPGIRITRDEEPVIWNVVDKIAQATKQRTPDALYTVAEVNAYAGRVRGANFLILGLPLMAVLRVSELRAVIAHEFGHYQANDTAWSSRIYRCRHAIDDVIDRFQEVEEMVPRRCIHWMVRASVRFVSLPFRAYRVIFRLALRSVVKSQEHAADRIASAVAGPAAVRNAIRIIERTSPAFDGYWQDVVLPIVKTGYCPKLSEGFLEYLQAGGGVGIARTNRTAPVVGFAALDMHPSSQSRFSSLIIEPNIDRASSEPDPPAITLIRQVGEYERQILTLLGFKALTVLDGRTAPAAIFKSPIA